VNWSIWHAPHPFIFNKSSVILPGLLAFLVIFLLAPFGFAEMSLQDRLLQGVISALIASGSVLGVVLGLQYFAAEWTKPAHWTVGKEVLLFIAVVFVIAVLHFGLILPYTSGTSPVRLFQQVVVRTIAISVFPILGLVLYEQYHHRTKQVKRVLELNKAIRAFHNQKVKEAQMNTNTVWFAHENGKPACQLKADAIQYIRSEGNYFEVYHLNEDSQLKKQLVRNTLRAAEDLLDGAQFWRVHRSYLVNLRQVETVSGNARDLELEMKNTGLRIPVSRSKANLLTQKLNA
jgi:hypothetical protein